MQTNSQSNYAPSKIGAFFCALVARFRLPGLCGNVFEERKKENCLCEMITCLYTSSSQ